MYISVSQFALHISDIFRADKIIYSVLMPLLARLNPRLDPTWPITPIPTGNQSDTVTQERLQEIITEISNSKQLEQKNSQKQGTIQALYPF